MEPQTQKGSSKVWIGVVIIALIIAGGVWAFTGKKVTPTDTNTTVPVGDTTGTPTSTVPPTDTTITTTVPPVDNKSVYKNGTYTVIGDYRSPGGAEQIKVTVTIANDVITDATVASQTVSGDEAVRFQSRFISGFKSQVIGKNIADVSLSRVSGSSLTPGGWNDAIAKIQAEAKV